MSFSDVNQAMPISDVNQQYLPPPTVSVVAGGGGYGGRRHNVFISLNVSAFTVLGSGSEEQTIKQLLGRVGISTVL